MDLIVKVASAARPVASGNDSGASVLAGNPSSKRQPGNRDVCAPVDPVATAPGSDPMRLHSHHPEVFPDIRSTDPFYTHQTARGEESRSVRTSQRLRPGKSQSQASAYQRPASARTQPN